jgi:hypothetical protein
MKRFLLLLATSVIVTASIGNIAPPNANISEIYFAAGGAWSLELGFYSYYYNEFDSIIIESSEGSSIINHCTLIPGGGWPNFDSITVITNANLLVPVSINPLGDYIKVTSYIFGYGTNDYVAFGTYPGSFLDCKQSGESLTYVAYSPGPALTSSFCVDKSPTIGSANDSTGVLSNFSGKVYDTTGNVFTQGFFQLPPLCNTTINIQPDGSFDERVFARRYTFDTITIYFPPWPYTHLSYVIQPVDFCLRPDTLHTQDIIAKRLVTSTEKREPGQENVVVVSPNPFTNKVTFYFNIADQHNSDDMEFSIYRQDGRQLKQVRLLVNQKKWEWIPGENIPSGLLLFQLNNNGRVIKSGKLIKL